MLLYDVASLSVKFIIYIYIYIYVYTYVYVYIYKICRYKKNYVGVR